MVWILRPTLDIVIQILLGLNLYGLDYSVTGGNHILGPQYIDLLATYKPKFSYDDVSKEHFFEYKYVCCC